MLGPGSVHGGKFDVAIKLLRKLHRLDRHVDDFLLRLLNHLVEMGLGCGEENMDSRRFRFLQRARGHFDILFQGSGESGDCGTAYFLSDLFHRFKITWRRHRKTRFYDIHLQ